MKAYLRTLVASAPTKLLAIHDGQPGFSKQQVLAVLGYS